MKLLRAIGGMRERISFNRMSQIQRESHNGIINYSRSLWLIFLCIVALLPAERALAFETARGFIFPVGTEWKRPGDGNEYSITQGYCVYNSSYGYHTGVDLANGSAGGSVKSVANGQIVDKESGSGWGNMIRIEHRLPNGEIWYSQYGHMLDGSMTSKGIGAWVQMGETIGQVGSTGISTGPHLHLEIKTVNTDGPGYVPNPTCDSYNYREPLQFIRDRLYNQGNWYYWTFDTTNDKDGWSSWGDCGWSVSGGLLVQCQGSDPRLISPYMDRTPDANYYVKIVAANLGTRTDGEFFLQTRDYGFNTTNRTFFTLSNDGGYKTIIVRLRDVPGYSSGGNWRQFRIDPVGPNSGANTFIDYIRYGSDAQAPTITSVSVSPNNWTNVNSFTVSWVGWDGPDDGSGFGSGIDHYEVRKNGGSWVGQGLNTSWTGTASVQCENTLDVRAVDKMGNVGSYVTARFYYDSTAPSNPTTVTSSSHSLSTWSTDRTVDVCWSGASDGCGSGISGYSWQWSTSATTVPDQTQDGTATCATSSSLTDGSSWYFHVRSRDNLGQWATGAKHYGPFYIDGTLPSNPTTVTSSSHSLSTWSSDRTVDVCWSGASDGAGSGISGYSWQWSTSATTVPDQTQDGTATCATSSSLTDGSSWYFHVRSRDNLGQWATGAKHYGPFWIDGTAPSNPTTLVSASHEISVCSSDPTIDIAWSGATDGDGSGISGFSWEWSTYSMTVPDQTQDGSESSAVSPLLADGASWYFHVRSCDQAGIWATDAFHVGPFCVETTAPSAISNLMSTSHTPNVWSNDGTVDLAWDPAHDDESGILGYSYCWSYSPITEPDDLVDTPEVSVTSESLSDGSSWYFHVRAINGIGIAGTSSHLGPFCIDVTPPSITVISPNGGELWLYNTIQIIEWAAIDSASGVESLYIYYSTDGGATYSNYIGTVLPPETTSSWIVPLHFSDQARIRIFAKDAVGNQAEDVSDGVFTMGSEWIDVTTPITEGKINGFGLAWTDYDNDDDLDLHLCNSTGNQLLRNDAGTYVDDSDILYSIPGNGRSAVWGDYDNDGMVDLFVGYIGPNKLYRGLGDQSFVEIAVLQLEADDATFGATWVDYNRDGKLDLFYANAGADTSRLLTNIGGTFSNNHRESCIELVGECVGAAWGDYDNDGDQDLYVSQWGAANRLLQNDGYGNFVDATSGPLALVANGQGVGWVDYDNDGDLDLYIANYGASNKLLRNEGLGEFVDVTSEILGSIGENRGFAWGDYDNDGDLDLYLTRVGRNLLLRNDDGEFVDVTYGALADSASGRAVSWGDYNNDGRLDLYVVNDGASNRMIENQCDNDNNWAQVVLVGTRSNRSAIGARIRIVAGGLQQIREISAGTGYLTQAPFRAHFGLGIATFIDTLEVTWPAPNSKDVRTSLAANAIITIEESMSTSVDDLALPVDFVLHQCYPNPFNPVTTIRYEIAARAHVRLEVYDVGGRYVRTLVDEQQNPQIGGHQVVWNGLNYRGEQMASGVYFYRLSAGSFHETRKMIILR